MANTKSKLLVEGAHWAATAKIQYVRDYDKIITSELNDLKYFKHSNYRDEICKLSTERSILRQILHSREIKIRAQTEYRKKLKAARLLAGIKSVKKIKKTCNKVIAKVEPTVVTPVINVESTIKHDNKLVIKPAKPDHTSLISFFSNISSFTSRTSLDPSRTSQKKIIYIDSDSD